MTRQLKVERGDKGNLDEQGFDVAHSNRPRLIRLVEDREHGHDILVLILTNELSQCTNIIERSLSVGHSHHAVQEVDRSLFRRVIVSVLRSWDGVEVEVDAETVLSSPGECLNEVLPTDVGEEGLSRVDLDDPVRNRQSNPVETSGSDLGEISFRLFDKDSQRRHSPSYSMKERRTMKVL